MDPAEESWLVSRRTSDGSPFGSLHRAECKQQFSFAATHAIVTAARCTAQNIQVDVDCIDFTIRQAARHLRYSNSMIDVQLKCTDQDVLKDDGIHWQLDKKHYDKLRDPESIVRKILVVQLVPKNLDEWLVSHEEGMLLRAEAYWACIEGAPSIDTDSKTILLPSANRFNVGQLLAMLKRVGDGGAP